MSVVASLLEKETIMTDIVLKDIDNPKIYFDILFSILHRNFHWSNHDYLSHNRTVVKHVFDGIATLPSPLFEEFMQILKDVRPLALKAWEEIKEEEEDTDEE